MGRGEGGSEQQGENKIALQYLKIATHRGEGGLLSAPKWHVIMGVTLSIKLIVISNVISTYGDLLCYFTDSASRIWAKARKWAVSKKKLCNLKWMHGLREHFHISFYLKKLLFSICKPAQDFPYIICVVFNLNQYHSKILTKICLQQGIAVLLTSTFESMLSFFFQVYWI